MIISRGYFHVWCSLVRDSWCRARRAKKNEARRSDARGILSILLSESRECLGGIGDVPTIAQERSLVLVYIQEICVRSMISPVFISQSGFDGIYVALIHVVDPWIACALCKQ